MANIFNKLFSFKSPLILLSQQASYCKRSAEVLKEAIHDYLEEKDVSQYTSIIHQLESDADKVKIELKKIYERMKWTYFSKIDLIDIAHNLDGVIDAADDVAKLLNMNKIDHIDNTIKSKIFDLTAIMYKTVLEVEVIIDELHDVAESVFSKSEISLEDKRVEEIESEERESDKLGIEIGRLLFSKKKEMHPVDIIFMNNIVRMIMKISDRSENVAEKVQLLLHHE